MGPRLRGRDELEWRLEPGLTPYPEAIAAMETRADAVRAGTAPERIWLVEHPPVYTAGTSATPVDLLDPDRFPVHATGRGGKHTYHGPGQRVVYVMLDLDARGRDIRRYVAALENWVIAALLAQGVASRTIPGKVGVWTDTGSATAKIAAIGVRVRRWVTYHGLSINVDPDLAHFGGIIPCGLGEPVTSLAALGVPGGLAATDAALLAALPVMLASLPVHKDIAGTNHGA